MTNYLDELNPQQRAAVEYIDGPQLVIAGAGSGKTRVLTYKIVHLLAKGYEPWRILALTFTNKAAREMKERINALSGQSTASRLWMGTFHSVFARILRANASRLGYPSDFTIYDATDSKNLVKAIIRDLDLDEKVYKPSTITSIISNAKNALLLPDAYLADREIQAADKRSNRPMTGVIYKGYCQRCRVAGAMDFDDLLVNTTLLLRDNDDIRRHYQEFFRYILVDEYQDTNFAQHTIITQLCGTAQKVCMVGDDAQSIYSFRGANIRNILNLKRSYPSLEIFKLEQNYRSSENIINAAGSLIAKNVDQIPKNVFSANGPGERIEVVKSYSDFEESFLVANRIVQLKRSYADSYDDFAILYRTNAQSRILEESLRKRDIPYRIYGGQSFYNRKEVKDATAYFRLAINPADEEAFKRVVNFPARGIGETTLKKLISTAIKEDRSLWEVACDPIANGVDINRGTVRKLEDFTSMIQSFNTMHESGATADDLARRILADTKMMTLYISDNTPENISRYENLEELLNSTIQFVADRREEGLEDRCSMTDFMTQASLSTDADTEEDSTPIPKVTLMTIHAAKGLEFANVFVVGVEEDLLPSAMSAGSAAEIEEERRLLYVAITRAKRYCMLSYASSRFRNGTTTLTSPSRFLSDIDTKFLRFVSGSEIAAATIVTTPRAPHRSNYSSSPRRSPESMPPRRTLGTIPRVSDDDNGVDLHNAQELAIGMHLEHTRFGRGEITAIDAANPNGARIVVNFNNVEMKTLLLRFARFKIITD